MHAFFNYAFIKNHLTTKRQLMALSSGEQRTCWRSYKGASSEGAWTCTPACKV